MSDRIDTAEDYIRRTESNFIKLLSGQSFEEPAGAPLPPHPNEVLTAQAVRDGIYGADEVGIPDPD